MNELLQSQHQCLNNGSMQIALWSSSNAPTSMKAESSLDRLLRVIDLFTPEKPEWTADEIGEVMSVSRATQYRYLRSLCNAGLLAPAGKASYLLGPRFVVLDRQIRLSDPLLRHAPALMTQSCRQLGVAQLLCTYFGNEVLCIHQESADPSIRSSMERGRPFPLFRGAPSKAILAWLPENHLRNLMLSHAYEIRQMGLGFTWVEFRNRLKKIRADGYYLAHGEIDPELMGIGTPILRSDDELAGSLTTIFPRQSLAPGALERLVHETLAVSAEVSKQLTTQKSTPHTNLVFDAPPNISAPMA